MDLEEATNIDGIKLVDTNVNRDRLADSFMAQLYHENPFDSSKFERIDEEIDQIRSFISILNNSSVYSIEEVVKEQEHFLGTVNKLINFYSNCRKGHPIHGNSRRDTKLRKKLKDRFEEDDFPHMSSEHGKIEQINALSKDILRLIKKLKEKDITKQFSEQETSLYNQYFRYFSEVAEKYNLKKDFRQRHLIFKGNASPYPTDEKIVSAALVASNRSPVVLLSSDTDIWRLMSFFNSESRYTDYELPRPQNRIDLYSNFKEGFELNFTLMPNQVCT